MISNELKKEIVDRIRSVSTPIKIFLFGSYAYGDPNPESDLDIAVICKTAISKSKESVIIRKALKGILHSIDVIVIAPDEFDYYSHEAGSIFKTIAEKGVLIYA